MGSNRVGAGWEGRGAQSGSGKALGRTVGRAGAPSVCGERRLVRAGIWGGTRTIRILGHPQRPQKTGSPFLTGQSACQAAPGGGALPFRGHLYPQSRRAGPVPRSGAHKTFSRLP